MNSRIGWWCAVLIVASGGAGAGCGKGKSTSAKATNATPASGHSTSSGNPLTAPVDYLGAVGAAQRQSVKTLDAIQVQQAVRAYAAGEEHLPASLQDLIKDGYLPRLPDLPRGMRYDYNPANGRVQIVPVATGAGAGAGANPATGPRR